MISKSLICFCVFCKNMYLFVFIYLGWEDPLEKEMATQSSTLTGEFPWTEEPGGLQGALQLQGVANRVRQDLMT